MTKIKITVKTFLASLVLLLGLLNTQVLSSPFEEPFDPLKVKKIISTKIDYMSKVINACGFDEDNRYEYWPLTESFVTLLDQKVEKELKKLDYKTPFNKPIHKQYLGVQKEDNQRFVYIFIYPKPSRVIEKEEGNPVLLCRKNAPDNIIFKFDRDAYKLINIKL